MQKLGIFLELNLLKFLGDMLCGSLWPYLGTVFCFGLCLEGLLQRKRGCVVGVLLEIPCVGFVIVAKNP